MDMILDIMIGLVRIMVGLIALKSITIGGEFNFMYWAKYGKDYTDWYKNRPVFDVEEAQRKKNIEDSIGDMFI